MITRSLVSRLYRASTAQRWTDHVRPTDLTVLGKNAHMMVFAWSMGRQLEQRGEAVDWQFIIEGGIFDTLRRCVLTDIKDQVWSELMANEEAKHALNTHIVNELKDDITAVDRQLATRMRTYFLKDVEDSAATALSRRVIRAASHAATAWEYELIKPLNSTVPALEDVSATLEKAQADHKELLCLMDPDGEGVNLGAFASLCGRLRFQERWSQTPILPRRPVMDHELMVATLAYLSELQIKACERRRYNTFFGALFHDVGEITTRDIISPVKYIDSKVGDVIQALEEKLLEEKIVSRLPEHMKAEFKYWVQDEFTNKRKEQGTDSWIAIDEPGHEYNADADDVYDGKIVKGCDQFAAYMEAYYSVKYGVTSTDLKTAIEAMFERRKEYEAYGADFEVLYELCFHEVEPLLRMV